MSATAAPAAPPAPLGLLLTALDSILEREACGLEALLRIEGRGRGNGQDVGLGSPIAQVAWALDHGRELRTLLAGLAPHEAAVRALLADRISA